MALGFTALEAQVYAFLLGESTATGYRIAQALGKPVANTYKALESLERKGAVIVDDGESRVYRAVPAKELLGHLERRFSEHRERAARALSEVGGQVKDDRLYQLRSRGQVFERARHMLARCEHVAVADAFPTMVEELREQFEAAARRGVEIVIKTYQAVRVADARVVVRPRGQEIIEAHPGEMISLNIDGAEHLLALLKPGTDDVFQAVWTGSAIVSYLLYNGLVNEVSQAAAMHELEGDTTVDKLRGVFNGLRHLHPASSRGPAYQNLMKQLGLPAVPTCSPCGDDTSP